MASLNALAAPLALILPVLGQGTAVPVAVSSAAHEAAEAPVVAAAPQCDADPAATIPVERVTHQVRIEQRVIIRISPQRSSRGNSLFASLPQQPLNTRYEERKMNNCIPAAQIAGVQTGSGNQLLLFLSDRRIVRANLEKACRARDFYSGFHVERSKDGLVCTGRDKLQSRTGAVCEVARMRELVAVSE